MGIWVATSRRGQMDWAQVTFRIKGQPPGTTPGARGNNHRACVSPGEWKSLQIAEGNIDTWTFDKRPARTPHSNGGKTARDQVGAISGNNPNDEPAVLYERVKYWGTPRNDGFVMMPNEIETYREGPKAYEFKGTNGFMLTFDMTSKDVPAAKGSSMNY